MGIAVPQAAFKLDSANIQITEMVCRAQSSTYSQVFHVLSQAINPTITGLALRLAFHDAGTYDPNSTTSKGG